MRQIATALGLTPIASRALGFVVFALALLPGVPAAGQQVVVSGTDCWQTEPGTNAAIPPLPAGFFGPLCAAYPGALVPMTGGTLTPEELANCDCPPSPPTEVTFVDVHGDPVPAGSIHAVSQVPFQAPTPDTCVRRKQDATFPGGVGVPETIPIELIELSLVSVNPITVNCPGPTLWNVFVTEDGVQAEGTMELTPTVLVPAAQGVATVPNLPVDVRFRFEPVGGGSPVVQTANVNMQNPNPQSPGPSGTFRVLISSVPALSDSWRLLLGAAVLALGAVWLRSRRAAHANP